MGRFLFMDNLVTLMFTFMKIVTVVVNLIYQGELSSKLYYINRSNLNDENVKTNN